MVKINQTGADRDLWRINPQERQLAAGDQVFRLTPIMFKLLMYFLRNRDRLLSYDELLCSVWPSTIATRDLLKANVHELRRIFRDDARNPRFVETVRGHGYRFIGPVEFESDIELAPSAAPSVESEPAFFGRLRELQTLEQWLLTAPGAGPRILAIEGEIGVGKTRLANELVSRLNGNHDWVVGRGVCLASYGNVEPYLPTLEALGEICQLEQGQQLVGALVKFSPAWLAQLPQLTRAFAVDPKRQLAAAGSQARMLRELAWALEGIGSKLRTLFWFDDLQWADSSTLDLIRYLAERPSKSGNIMLVTIRNSPDAAAKAHDLMTELQARNQCKILTLRPLVEQAVLRHLADRYRGLSLDSRRSIYRHSGGNPMFLAAIEGTLVEDGTLRQVGNDWVLAASDLELGLPIPPSLYRLVTQQVHRLDPLTISLLQVGGIARRGFSAAIVAHVTGLPQSLVEERLLQLSRRRQFVHECGSSTSLVFAFDHVLYPRVLYDEMPAARRAELHRKFGRVLERLADEQHVPAIADLAWHFGQGRETPTAVRYAMLAAENALSRYGSREAAIFLRDAVDGLSRLPPDTCNRVLLRDLQIKLGVALSQSQGYASPAVEEAFERAEAISGSLSPIAHSTPARFGLWLYHLVRGNQSKALRLAEDSLAQAHTCGDRKELLHAHCALGNTLLYSGCFRRALEVLTAGLGYADLQGDLDAPTAHGHDPSVALLAYKAICEWMVSKPSESSQTIMLTLTLAERIGHPNSQALAHFFAALLKHFERTESEVLVHADVARAVANEHELPQWQVETKVIMGWAWAMDGRVDAGIDAIQCGIAERSAMGLRIGRTLFQFMLADAWRVADLPGNGLAILDEALGSNGSQECWLDAELWRLRGELLVQADCHKHLDEAKAMFYRAAAISRSQGAWALEARALAALATGS